MEFQGVFDGGVVRPTEPVELPPGTPVEFHCIDSRRAAVPSHEFWNGGDLSHVTKNASANHPRSVADLRGDWPADDSLDEFLAELRRMRN